MRDLICVVSYCAWGAKLRRWRQRYTYFSISPCFRKLWIPLQIHLL